MSSGFITESEILEARKKRQEEWERVLKEGREIERPKSPVDSRSLYERLQEQKQKKDLEYEEAHKLKNMIKGLDDDEIEFLNVVDRAKVAADQRTNLEVQNELSDYRNKVASFQEKSLEQKTQEVSSTKAKSNSIVRNSQTKLLKGAVIIKTANKRKNSEGEEQNVEDTIKKPKVDSECVSDDETSDSEPTGLKCIGILPGLGSYDTSSSEASSDSDGETSQSEGKLYFGRKDLLNKEAFFGRKVNREKHSTK